jgi:hypothetical protein
MISDSRRPPSSLTCVRGQHMVVIWRSLFSDVRVSKHVLIEWLVRKTNLNEGLTVHGEIFIKQEAILSSLEGRVRIR